MDSSLRMYNLATNVIAVVAGTEIVTIITTINQVVVIIVIIITISIIIIIVIVFIITSINFIVLQIKISYPVLKEPQYVIQVAFDLMMLMSTILSYIVDVPPKVFPN